MEDIKKKLSEKLESFILEMNVWERYCCEVDKSELSWDKKTELMKIKIKEIFDKFCTQKQRKLGAPNVLSWGEEGSYDYDNTEEKVVKVELISATKANVFSFREDPLEEEFCYTFIFRNNNWLIDLKKSKYNDEEKWKPALL